LTLKDAHINLNHTQFVYIILHAKINYVNKDIFLFISDDNANRESYQW